MNVAYAVDADKKLIRATVKEMLKVVSVGQPPAVGLYLDFLKPSEGCRKLKELIQLAVASSLPFLPVAAIEIPLKDILLQVLKLLK